MAQKPWYENEREAVLRLAGVAVDDPSISLADLRKRTGYGADVHEAAASFPGPGGNNGGGGGDIVAVGKVITPSDAGSASALASAIASATSLGAPVALRGDFTISGSVALPTGAHIDGRQSTITQTANLTPVFTIGSGSPNVTLENVTVIGKTTDYVNTTLVYSAAGVTVAAENVKILNCRFLGCAGAGVRLFPTSATNVTIEGCTIVGPGDTYITSTGHSYAGGIIKVGSGGTGWTIRNNDISEYAQGISLGGGVTDLLITGNRIHNIPGQNGISLADLDGATITNNHIRDIALQGVKIQVTVSSADANGVVVDGNLILECGSHAVLLTNNNNNAARVRNVVVSANVIRNAGDAGISGTRCADVLVTDNIIAGTTGLSGIQIDTSTGVDIIGNRIIGVNRDGVFISGITQFSIVDNRIYQPAVEDNASNEFGIHLQGSNSEGQITNNLITDPTGGTMQYGIYIESGTSLSSVDIIDNVVSGAKDYGYRGLSAAARTFRGNRFAGTTGSLQTPPTSGDGYPFREVFGTAAPASGTWRIGDRCWNSAPAASGVLGWVCTGNGTPGTWKSFGTIAS